MCRPQTTNREMVVNCKKNSARLPESSDSSQIDGKRILDRWPHLLRRAILDAGSAMLDYDFKYFLLRHAIFFYSINICFWNDRTTPMRTEVSPSLVDGLQELCRMMVVLCLIIMNTSCFVVFLVWFLNRNFNSVSLTGTQQWKWIAYQDAVQSIESSQNAGNWKH